MLKYLILPSVMFSVVFDLDIILPPGDPLEGMTFLMPPVPIETRRFPPEPADPKSGGTSVLRKVFPVAPPVVTLNITSFSPIPTVDFPIEVRWVTQSKMSRDEIADGFGYESVIAKRARFEAYLRTLTRIAHRFCHFNRTGELEYTLYFTLMGAPAGLNAVAVPLGEADMFPEFADFCRRAKSYINPEENVPELPDLEDPFEEMVAKLAVLELVSYHPFTDSPYAPELDNFSREELLPVIKKLLGSENKRVRRNAVYYLGVMRTHKALKELFNVLRTTKDNVEKVRALFFLTQYGYHGLSEYLVERLGTEEDEVFRLMIINSLGSIGDPSAFRSLVSMLRESEIDEWEIYSAILKSAMLCVDTESEDDLEMLEKAAIEVQKKLKAEIFTDPAYTLMVVGRAMPPSYVISYVANARRGLVDELSQIALALSGNRGGAEVIKKLMSVSFNELMGREYSPSLAGALDGFQSGSRTFVSRVIPRLFRGKKGLSEKFLRGLILSGYEHDNVIFAAIDAYFNDHGEKFDDLVVELLRVQARGRIVDRALRYAHILGSFSEKLENYLNLQLKRYGRESGDNEKHLATLALFYLGSLGKLEDKMLIKLIKSELGLLAKEEEEADLREQSVWGAVLKSRSYLYRIAIQMLGKNGSERGGEFLLKLVRAKDAEVRRLAVKALGDFDSDDVRKKLFGSLLDRDGWVRVISYLSLRRITGAGMPADWYFAGTSGIRKSADSYEELVKSKSNNK